MKEQRQFQFWLGIGFGYDKSIIGGLGQVYVVKEYVFLFMKYGICNVYKTMEEAKRS